MNNIAPGQQIGPYRIINQIGQGGMATVYKAYHAAMDRYVAIKVLPSQFAQNKEFIQRFEQEARTIAKLEHAHILPVYDYGEHDSITYLVMRYLDAGTLKDRIQRGDLSLSETDKLFTQLAGALAYAHEMNVIHRDIKPSNAMVNSRGELFLTDFGIAKLLESTAQFTATGSITGTPAYMSPEQAQGEKLDSRSDIYSLGIVLYEMVTGKVPFEAETPLAVILKHINAPLPPPTTLKPDLPPEIEKVILKALAKNRDDRFATCDEFLNAWKIALTQTQTARVMTPSVDEVKAVAPTLAASPTATAVPAAIRESPAPKKRPTRWLAIIGAGALALISLCVCAVSLQLYNQNQLDRQQTAAAVVSSPLPSASPATAFPAKPSTPSVQAQVTATPVASGWTSWVAINTVYALTTKGNRIIAGGPNGLSFWNGMDGKVAERFTVNNGLPNPKVNALFVDDDGSLWVGTDEGLLVVRDDKWITYLTEQGLDGNYITSIGRVGKRLVVGTSYSRDGGGLNEFDPQEQKFKPIKFPSVQEDKKDQLSYNVRGVATDKSGMIWVATTNGLGRFDGKSWTRFGIEKGLPSNQILSMLVDKQDRLWIGTENGAALFTGERFKEVNGTQLKNIYDIEQDAAGTVWFPTYDGIIRLEPKDGTWKIYDHRNVNLPDVVFFSAARGEDGAMFFGTSNGIVRYDTEGKFVTWVEPNAPLRFSHSRILPAPDGSLWFIEQYGTNIDRFDLNAQKWSPLVSPCDCEPLTFDAEGNLWGGSYDAGLWIVTKDGKINMTTQNGLPSNRVVAVTVDRDGTAWVGTDKGLAFLRARKVEKVYRKADSGFVSEEVRVISILPDKSLVVGFEGGWSRFASGRWDHFPAPADFGAATDVEMSLDGVWIATSNGVYRFTRDGKWDHFKSGNQGVHLPSDNVNSVTLAPDGNTWFGTSEGAARFDGKTWEAFRPKRDHLIAPMVNDIYVTKSGEVWFATAGGVTRWKPDSVLRVTPLPSSSGSVLPEVLIATAQVRMGQELLSVNKRYSFKFQLDGDLVVYDNITSKSLWSSNTNTKGSLADYLVMQDDGNLVLYTKDGIPMWASNTAAKQGDYFLLMQDDGNLVIKRGKPYTGNEVPIWATNTAR